MKKRNLLFAMALLPLSLFAQTIWNIDKAHSAIGFTVTHMVITEVDGSFKSFSGSVTSSNADFTDANVDFTVEIGSINTEVEMRDNHLKSPDFFDAAKFPKATFKSSSFKKISGNKYELKGTLTIKNISKPVTFDVTYGGTVKDPYGNTKAGFKAITVINRFDYELKWNALTEAGGAVVGQDVTLTVKLELNQAK